MITLTPYLSGKPLLGTQWFCCRKRWCICLVKVEETRSWHRHRFIRVKICVNVITDSIYAMFCSTIPRRQGWLSCAVASPC